MKEPAAKIVSVSLPTPEIDTTENKFPMADFGLKVKDLNGNIVNMEDYKGKVIFLNFWATWCLPCVAEMPSINKLYKQFEGQDIAFFIVSNETIEKVKKYHDKKNYDLPFHVQDKDSFIPSMYYSPGIPTTFIINKNGRVVKASSGAEDWDDKEFVEVVKKMM